MANGKFDGKPSQRDRFIETARQLGADESEPAFDAKLAVIARQKPKDKLDKPGDEQDDDRKA